MSALDCQACGACCVNVPSNRAEGFTAWVEIADDDRILARVDLVRKLVVRDADGVRPLTDDDRAEFSSHIAGLAGRALRNLALAVRELDDDTRVRVHSDGPAADHAAAAGHGAPTAPMTPEKHSPR